MGDISINVCRLFHRFLLLRSGGMAAPGDAGFIGHVSGSCHMVRGNRIGGIDSAEGVAIMLIQGMISKGLVKMNILVINCGSSSLKFQVINSETEALLAKGLCERIGIDGSVITYENKVTNAGKEVNEIPMPDHNKAVSLVLEALTNEKTGSVFYIYSQWSNPVYVTPWPRSAAGSVPDSRKPYVSLRWNTVYGSSGYNIFLTQNPKGTWYWNQATTQKATSTTATIKSFRSAKLKTYANYYVRIVTRRKLNGAFCTVPAPGSGYYSLRFRLTKAGK